MHNPHVRQRRAARWLLAGLPSLLTVSFSWQQSWWTYGFTMLVWREWDRSLLLRPPSPPPRERSPIREPVVLAPVALPPVYQWQPPQHPN
jgi:hypothetical protein